MAVVFERTHLLANALLVVYVAASEAFRPVKFCTFQLLNVGCSNVV